MVLGLAAAMGGILVMMFVGSGVMSIMSDNASTGSALADNMMELTAEGSASMGSFWPLVLVVGVIVAAFLIMGGSMSFAGGFEG